jgi:hypothetical protein
MCCVLTIHIAQQLYQVFRCKPTVSSQLCTIQEIASAVEEMLIKQVHLPYKLASKKNDSQAAHC